MRAEGDKNPCVRSFQKTPDVIGLQKEIDWYRIPNGLGCPEHRMGLDERRQHEGHTWPLTAETRKHVGGLANEG